MIDPSRPDYSNTPVAPARPQFAYDPVDAGARPRISILTPFYNTGVVFHETARSVFQQSLQQWEWLIVNDGSTEPTALAILDEYRTRDARIRVLDQPGNGGLSAARNAGFAAARTPYVLQLDSDDLIEPTAAEKWWWFLESHPECAFVNGYSVHFGAIDALWTGGFHEDLAFLDNNRVDATSLIRVAVHRAVNGYDSSNRDGLEDWDFWLRCASHGHWGATVPEFLDWYRRRRDHAGAWRNWDEGTGEGVFRSVLKQRYPALWTGGFPRLDTPPDADIMRDDLPGENRLRKTRPRLLIVLPWMMVGGADKFNADLLAGLTQRGWEITVVATLPAEHPWLPLFSRYTPDVFVLDRFLRIADYPRFMLYLLKSRQPDAILISNSEQGYLLAPYLRAHAPEAALLSFCHAVEDWKTGGYPRMSLNLGPVVDLSLAASQNIADWMLARGARPDSVQVCHLGVDVERYKPDSDVRSRVRSELGIADHSRVILTAARICADKQPRVLARSLHALHEEGHEYTAIVAGDGPDLPWLREFVREHGLEHRVHLMGSVSPERLEALLAAADIFFLPSRREGIALACFEAMSAGLAVVSADVGAQRELIVPGSGVLVESGPEDVEVRRYTAALAELLKDAELRARLGASARERILASFRVDQMCDRLAALLQATVAASKKQPATIVPIHLAALLGRRAVEQMQLIEATERMWTVRQREERRSAESPDVAWVVELQTAKRWLEQQYKAWQRLADERGQALADLESAKRWLEEQYQAWQRTAEERAQALADLESGKQWLEQQYEAWRHTAGEREVVIGELRECVAKLERSNRLLEEANAAMRRELEELRRTGFAGWFGRRPRGVERTEAPNQLALHSPAPDKETTR